MNATLCRPVHPPNCPENPPPPVMEPDPESPPDRLPGRPVWSSMFCPELVPWHVGEGGWAGIHGDQQDSLHVTRKISQIIYIYFLFTIKLSSMDCDVIGSLSFDPIKKIFVTSLHAGDAGYIQS